MKKFSSVILIAGVMCVPVTTYAAAKTSEVTAETEKAAVAIESSLEKMQKTVSGMVKESQNGLILETSEGVYKLKGLSLEEIIGKEVHVTGVVKTGKDENIIYVVKAGVQ